MTFPVTVLGDVDPKAVAQMETCAIAGDATAAAICADGHPGYSMPIGGVVAYEDYVSPSGVGYDIGCGNLAVATNLLYPDISSDIPALMDLIFEKIPFGPGKGAGKSDHPVIDRIRTESPFQKVAALHQKASQQLGSVGGGNHYVDLFRDEKTDRVWVGVHFGSRGFGHTVATMFLDMAAPHQERGDVAGEDRPEEPPTLIRADSPMGYAYIEAMQLAGEYAAAGREVVVQRVLDMLGAVAVDKVHNHHNFAWQEEHFGRKVWVIRKGSTPAFPDQRGFVGATMGETSVILRGTEPTVAVEAALQRDLMYSTVHGAGRLMSRTRAAGKQRKRWTCSNRDCDWVQPPYTHKPEDGTCPTCGNTRLTKQWVVLSEGEIDWNAARENLQERNIELRGAAADEAPLAYKRLDDVLDAQGGTIEVLNRLRPIGVAMAGPGVKADD